MSVSLITLINKSSGSEQFPHFTKFLKDVINYYTIPNDKEIVRENLSHPFSGLYAERQTMLYETIEKALTNGQLVTTASMPHEKDLTMVTIAL